MNASTNALPTLAPVRPAPARTTRALRIGIDARAAVEVPAGRGRVVRELLRALAAREDEGQQRYVLYARQAWREQPLDGRFRWRTIDARDPWWHVRAAASGQPRV